MIYLCDETKNLAHRALKGGFFGRRGRSYGMVHAPQPCRCSPLGPFMALGRFNRSPAGWVLSRLGGTPADEPDALKGGLATALILGILDRA